MAIGALLTSYLSKFGVRGEELSGETVAFAAALDAVAQVEPAVADAVLQELVDERRHLKLIASENFASSAVLLAMGNWLSDLPPGLFPASLLRSGLDERLISCHACTRTSSASVRSRSSVPASP